ncbi:sigma-70 family RNA polymerase sigma factor [Nitriliruptor alkaliphilus]|uniref:sigma-70 family RNA polymerase sigma factor n=1 Tax=Nitriliruptor alkaliphilus TaxID=427918 RepID=UPI000697536F|nr:sigma-70 family RNA polymerase sigma factor [Nitriliruptor alkaliphilus]
MSVEAAASTATPEATAEVAAIDPEVVALVDRARTGDAQAFADLYDRYVDQIFAYVYRRVGHRQLAEDLVGDVFLRAFRRLSTFEWQGVDLGAWITTIARNRVHDHFKSARFRLERTTDEVREPAPSGQSHEDPERIAVARDMARALGAALEGLKGEHREVIELRFIHDLSVAETAAVMERSVGATKALQYRALKALSGAVQDHPELAKLAATGLTGLLALLVVGA